MESTSEVVSTTVADNSVCVEDFPEKSVEKKGVEAEITTVSVKKQIEGDKTNVISETVTITKELERKSEPCSSTGQQEEIEEIVEEVEVEDDKGEEDVSQKMTEEVIDTPDGGQTKTITIRTVKQVTPCSTKTVVTTTSVTNEAPSAAAVTTIITTIPPTPTTTEDVENPTKEFADVDKKMENNEHEQIKEESKEEEIEEEEEEVEEEEEEEELKKEDNKKTIKNEESKKSDYDETSPQQLHKDQVPQEGESQPQHVTAVKEQTVVDAAPSVVTQTNQHETMTNKQDNLNNTLKDIISSIDNNIKAEENIAALKERELELLKKQQELAKEIERQKLLAQKLANENQLQQQSNSIPPKTYQQPTTNLSKYSTYEEIQDENVYTRKSETFESRESTNASKKIDLHKIFTPATDAEEILPKNRKLYASSAFYSPTLHPTVEDQVELARRISHSLSDISNQQSRGHSMYVNRKKRSVKWVHEGCGQETQNIKITNQEEYDVDDEEEKENNIRHDGKVPMKFLMNPCGQIRDINTLRESLNTETGLLSPDVSAEVVTALQAQKGKGAELFAKRRKLSEKWVVDESNIGAQSPSGLPDYHHQYQQPRPSTSPSILPAYTDAAKHRVQLNLHQEQLLEKYAKPGFKVVQTPWKAALNSGSASTAFVEEQKLSPYPSATLTPSPTPQLYDANQEGIIIPLQTTTPTSTDSGYGRSYNTDDYKKYPTHASAPLQQAQYGRHQQYSGSSSRRELAYKPSIPQGWKTPSMSLPKDLYMPKEIPLQSYAPPPVVAIPASVPSFLSNIAGYETNYSNNQSYSPVASYSLPDSSPVMNKSYGAGSGYCTFPINAKPYQQGFSSTLGHHSNQPPKQQYLPPQSYQTIPQNSNKNIHQVSFNPSPLPYDKLAKFENPSSEEYHRYGNSTPSRGARLNVRGSKVRNTSPAPFGVSYNTPYSPSLDGNRYGATPSPTSRPQSSLQQYSGHNTPQLNFVTSNQILNAPSYNTSARGWRSSGIGGGATTGYQHPQSLISSGKPQIVNAASMPYTDF